MPSDSRSNLLLENGSSDAFPLHWEMVSDRARWRAWWDRRYVRMALCVSFGAVFGLAVAFGASIAAVYVWGLVEWVFVNSLGS